MILVYAALAAVGAISNAVIIGTPVSVVVGMIVTPASYAFIEWMRHRRDG